MLIYLSIPVSKAVVEFENNPENIPCRTPYKIKVKRPENKIKFLKSVYTNYSDQVMLCIQLLISVGKAVRITIFKHAS